MTGRIRVQELGDALAVNLEGAHFFLGRGSVRLFRDFLGPL